MIEIIWYVLSAIMALAASAWAVQIRTMAVDAKKTPRLEDYDAGALPAEMPLVSVIVPARNEEAYMRACLESLAASDCPRIEIIAVDDSSEDRTREIMGECASRHPKIVCVDAGPKPEGWIGKNWPCHQGVLRASGQLLLFTDADTRHAPHAARLAAGHLVSRGLDALTVIPRLLSPSFWPSVALPVICTFLHTRFSAAKVNDPSKKTGYFFGSFFIIRRKVYEQVGGHEGTRAELVEDGALGKKVKHRGYKMRMVAGQDAVDGVWARDLPTQWQALKRIMVPLAAQGRAKAAGTAAAVAFLMAAPFALLGASLGALGSGPGPAALACCSAAACALMYAAVLADTRILRSGAAHAALAPLGGVLVSAGLAAGVLAVFRGAGVSWRGRSYGAKDCAKSTMSV